VFDDRSPIYQQIADKLRDDIRQGVLKPDQPVMSTSQYATFYGVNPTTVARGFRLLVDEGLLYKRRGVGTFVSANGWDELRDQRRERFLAEVFDPMVAEAVAIGIPLDDILTRIQNLKG
jgi:DNA-binding transcriptional regulator YhcF (GntR family)